MLPLVLSGDFNSMPVSSVLSAFYGEDIEDDETCTWPCPQVKRLKSKYVQVNTLYKRKRQLGHFKPVLGNTGRLQSAYNFYQLPAGKTAYNESFSRDDTMPPYTNYKKKFKALLDHIFYNEEGLTLLQLLETPAESELSEYGELPSVKFPSDHIRIEAKFLLPE